jgi:hypothetical protein
MPASHNLIVRKGETWSCVISATLNGSAVSHTGYTVAMDVRKSDESSSTLLQFTQGNGRVSINGSGDIVLALSSSETAALSFDYGVYDLKVTSSGGSTLFYLEGNFIVKENVTV